MTEKQEDLQDKPISKKDSNEKRDSKYVRYLADGWIVVRPTANAFGGGYAQ